MAWQPDYSTTAEARKYITRLEDAVDDTEIALAVTAASRAIDRATNRQFGVLTVAEQRFYTAHYDRRRCRWIVEIDDLMTENGLDAETQDADGVTVGTIDDYVLEPRNAAARGRPWTHLMVRPNSAEHPTGAVDEVAITAEWGWTSVPDAVKQAALLQTSRLFARRDSPYGVAGSPDQGSEMRLLARLDPDVAVALGPFVRWWAAR